MYEKQWYEALFENYAESYDQENFTKGTLQECDFIESELDYNRDRRILDVGCGTGRHAIELVKRGYRVTGIDLSNDQLNKAREKAEQLGINVEFLHRDARDFQFRESFDAVIMICEGALSLMETDEMNFKILENIASSLKSGGKLIFTALNALFPLHHSIENFLNSDANDSVTKDTIFDLLTFREYSTLETKDDDGNTKILKTNERYFTPPELKWMLKSLGFKKIAIFGCDVGNFSREVPVSQNQFELLVIAVKL